MSGYLQVLLSASGYLICMWYSRDAVPRVSCFTSFSSVYYHLEDIEPLTLSFSIIVVQRMASIERATRQSFLSFLFFPISLFPSISFHPVYISSSRKALRAVALTAPNALGHGKGIGTVISLNIVHNVKTVQHL
jgi:hypothetical protein